VWLADVLMSGRGVLDVWLGDAPSWYLPAAVPGQLGVGLRKMEFPISKFPPRRFRLLRSATQTYAGVDMRSRARVGVDVAQALPRRPLESRAWGGSGGLLVVLAVELLRGVGGGRQRK